jgi:hypothetical protein
MSTQWRNGRGHTKGRGRRSIDKDVLSTRFVHKADKDHSRAARNIGLATTGVGTGISAVSLPKHLRHLPAAMKNAKTGPNVSEGIKNSVKAVKEYSKPPVAPGQPTEGALKSGVGALRSGVRVARENPRISAALLVGATALHTANLAGEGIATHVLHSGGAATPKIKQPSLQGNTSKSWDLAQQMIVNATYNGLITQDEALVLGQVVYTDLCKTADGVTKSAFGHDTFTSNNIKLQPLKAPPPVKLDQPRLPATKIGLPSPGKSGAGSSGKTSNKKVKKLDIVGEISKLNEDKQQCFGWCSVVKVDGKDVVDKQNDMIEIDDIEEAAYDYMLTSRKGGDMHRRAPDGGVHHAADVIESFVLTPEKIEKMGLPEDVPQGWWIGMQVNDPDLWRDVKEGRKRKFSIHGSGQRTEVLVDD